MIFTYDGRTSLGRDRRINFSRESGKRAKPSQNACGPIVIAAAAAQQQQSPDRKHRSRSKALAPFTDYKIQECVVGVLVGVEVLPVGPEIEDYRYRKGFPGGALFRELCGDPRTILAVSSQEV